ncbi:hypothetical protein N9T93_00455 [Flavobacteriaceae bacterium]|nr:hypothetical protein [Flavobacteriaceae bacterium]
MKKLLLVLLLFMTWITHSQSSNYYDVKVTGEIDVNVKKDVRVTKTIKTIDYGALALANSEKEKNRLNRLKYSDEKNRVQSIEIAEEPIKAYNYGIDNKWETRYTIGDGVIKFRDKVAEEYGFKYFTFYHKIPHEALFKKVSETRGGYKYENISEDYISASIEINTPINLNSKKLKEYFKVFKGTTENDALKWAKNYNNNLIGEKDIDGNFYYDKELKRVSVFGKKGYKVKIAIEDDFENIIEDKYVAISNGILYAANVLVRGDKNEINFEQLEGRRFYFRRLLEQIISTSNFYDYKLD